MPWASWWRSGCRASGRLPPMLSRHRWHNPPHARGPSYHRRSLRRPPRERRPPPRSALRLRDGLLLRTHGRRLRRGADGALPPRVGTTAPQGRRASHIRGCPGPCAPADVVPVLLDGQVLWLHSIGSEALVLRLYVSTHARFEVSGCLLA